MTWQDDIDRDLGLIFDDIAGPGMLYTLERHFWLDLFRVPVFEAVEEHGIEVRHYGPILVCTIAARPRSPLFNLVLGAARPGAVEEGHLAEALAWTESLGVDCRIPVRLDFGEPGAVEDHLNRRGYRRTATLAMYGRDGAPPDFPEPHGIEVDELAEECEGFSHFLATGYGMEWTGEGFLIGLPGRRDWCSYIAVDSAREMGIGAATMMLHDEGVAQLGFAAIEKPARGRGGHLALIRRRIIDALDAGARQLFAVTEEPPNYPMAGSTAARNLVRAGFGPVSTRPLWRPPEDLVADEDEADDEPGDASDDEDLDGEI